MKDILKKSEINIINEAYSSIESILLKYVYWGSEYDAINANKAFKILEDFIKRINSKSWTKELEEKLENITSIIEKLYAEIQ